MTVLWKLQKPTIMIKTLGNIKVTLLKLQQTPDWFRRINSDSLLNGTPWLNKPFIRIQKIFFNGSLMQQKISHCNKNNYKLIWLNLIFCTPRPYPLDRPLKESKKLNLPSFTWPCSNCFLHFIMRTNLKRDNLCLNPGP